jgi:hypothetical protein
MRMPEEFIHYLWSHKLFRGELKTSQDEEIKVLKTGIHNKDSGPDFFNARLIIGETEWAGNVEIHTRASDWFKHNHQKDAAYDSVILHVVYEDDAEVYNQHGELIPVLCVKGLYPEEIYFRYKQLVGARDWIPCAQLINKVSDLTIFSWLDRVLVNRLERKTEHFEWILDVNTHHWEESFYILLARGFGFNTNADPFEQLARSTPLSIVNRHRNDVFQLEALMFGQAGLLNSNLKDPYNQRLLDEYSFLAKKYNLEAAQSWNWKFMRMRPVNFPTIRIAQFSQLLASTGHLLSRILEIEKLSDLRTLFEVSVSSYWLDHYTFGKSSKKSSKSLGQTAFDLLLINTIVPFLFVYGKHNGQEHISERALFYLHQTKPESNGTVRRWSEMGIKALHAGHSQAMLTLKNDYCNQIQCLECAIGASILNKR